MFDEGENVRFCYHAFGHVFLNNVHTQLPFGAILKIGY